MGGPAWEMTVQQLVQEVGENDSNYRYTGSASLSEVVACLIEAWEYAKEGTA